MHGVSDKEVEISRAAKMEIGFVNISRTRVPDEVPCSPNDGRQEQLFENAFL